MNSLCNQRRLHIQIWGLNMSIFCRIFNAISTSLNICFSRSNVAVNNVHVYWEILFLNNCATMKNHASRDQNWYLKSIGLLFVAVLLCKRNDSYSLLNLYKHLIRIHREWHASVEFLEMLENWLCDSLTCVKWNSLWSYVFQINFGVRQGSVLSPVLFAIYVDDVARCCKKRTLFTYNIVCWWYNVIGTISHSAWKVAEEMWRRTQLPWYGY